MIDARSQSYFSAEEYICFNSIYGFALTDADSIAKRECSMAPEDVNWNIMVANAAWAQILAGNHESEKWNAQFSDYLKKSRGLLKDADMQADKDLFNYIIIHAFKTRHELLNDNYLSAASNLNTCIDQISNSFGREEGYEPFYLTSGLYHYFMHRAHQEYVLMRPYLMIYPKGDKDLGLKYLYELTTSDDVFLKTESNYFLMRIYFDLEKNFDRAALHAQYLLKSFPDNLIYRYYLIQSLVAVDSADVAIEKERYLESVSNNSELSMDQKEHFKLLLEEID